MKRLWVKKWISGCMAFGLMLSAVLPAGAGHAAAADPQAAPELFVTEIVPNTKNTVDEFEFFEVYNNSNKELNLSDYTFIYWYTKTPGSNLTFEFSPVTLQPQQTLVFWYNNKNRSLQEFNDYYGVSLTESQVVNVSGFQGFANGGDRGVIIKNKQGVEIARASYLSGDTAEDQGVQYKLADSGIDEAKLQILAAPTPGSVTSGQVPSSPVILPDMPANLPPVVVHTPVTSGNAANDLVITADIKDPESTVTGSTYANESVTATVYYKLPSDAAYKTVSMVKTSDSGYTGIIPSTELKDTLLQYYIEVRDEVHTVAAGPYTVGIALPELDYAKLPPFLVTEIVPNSVNVGSSDGYEFIEIYNNTDTDLNFKDYNIQYRYTESGPEADLIWASTPEEVIIPSRRTLVFWIINSENRTKTVDDFNAQYNVNLRENIDIVRIYSDGMANTSARGIVVATNTKTELAAAYYIKDHVAENKAILYKYPSNGSNEMSLAGYKTSIPTPGSVEEWQVPAAPVHVPPDTVKPVFDNLNQVSEAPQSGDIHLKFDAKDDRKVKTVVLYYKTNVQPEYAKRYLAESYNDNFYHYTIYSPELIGKDYVDYYVTVSDGTNETRSPDYRIAITGKDNVSGLRLNVNDGDIVSGTRILKGASDSVPPDQIGLYVDGADMTDSAYHALESDAYFAFDVKGTNLYFQNAVTIGDEILRLFDDTINEYVTLSVPLSADRLKQENTITIRAGSKASPFEQRVEENLDNFEIKNVRLVLSDGTEIYDANYADKDQVLGMGDKEDKRNELIDFRFQIPSDKFSSRAYVWDTRQAADGPHEVKAAEAVNGERKATVYVDNTPPVIVSSVEEGQLVKGSVTIEASASDALAGVKKFEAYLDGQPIMLPYTAQSGVLTPGRHVLKLVAEDNAGNQAEKVLSFQSADEHPSKPELVAPAQEAEGVNRNADLLVKVSDPTNDPLKVKFYRGFKHNAADLDSFKGFSNSARYEPPKQIAPEGEEAFSPDDYDLIAKQDNRYLIKDATDKFPYHRFEVSLDASVKASDHVEIVWKGNSLPGRKVSLYAWNRTEAAWKLLDSRVAGTEDFELKAQVTAGDYMAEGHNIQVLVQDEIPAASDGYDYTFVWMSDTQYYSESYPHIYKSIVDWIAANKDEMKIEYVFHTGDLVDEADKPEQWAVATTSMKVLEDAGIPYGVLAGNHDVDHKLGTYGYYWEHFDEERFKKQPTYGGSYDNNRGHYDLISSHGNDYIMLYMGWGVGDKEIAWMNEVLKQYPDRLAILNFHEYLLVSGNRSPMGDKIYENVVVPNQNVIAVLSGHYHDAEMLADELDDDGDGKPDRKVYQMLADYQGAPEGGLGYIRLMQFDVDTNKLHIKTYSPYLDDYNFYEAAEYPGKDEFTLDLDLQPKTKRVATDYVEVNVYTDQLIGQQANIPSGGQASARWAGLDAHKAYQWYTTAEDAFGGKSRSDIWKFMTGGSISTPDQGGSPGNDSEGGTNDGIGTDEPKQDGDITVTPAQKPDGTFEVGKASIDEALTQGNGNTIRIRLATPDSRPQAQVAFDADSLRKIKQAGMNLRLETHDVSIIIPGSSIASEALNAVHVQFRVNSVPSAEAASIESRSLRQYPDLASTGTILSLELDAIGENVRTSVHQFDGPITVEWTLPQQKLNSIQPDYAGVYYVDGQNAQYVGGEFGGGKVTFTTDHFSYYAVLEMHKDFADLKGHWAESFVKKLAAKHMVDGVDEEHFAPDRPITRADLITMAVRSLGFTEPEYAEVFSDVSKDKYYAGFVSKAAEIGLAEGYNGRFRPEDSLTREEAVTVLMRLADYRNKAWPGADTADFADRGEISEWAREHVKRAKAAGIVEGRGDNRFEPKANVTRSELAKMLYLTIK